MARGVAAPACCARAPARRAPALPLILALCAVPAPALAQRDVGPVRVALFAGAHLTRPSAALLGLAGELDLKQRYVLAAAATLVTVSEGSYTHYELDGRWHPESESWLRPYLGAGFAITRSSSASVGGPAVTSYGVLALAGAETRVLGTRSFVEVVGVETGSFSLEVRGGVRLLVFGP